MPFTILAYSLTSFATNTLPNRINNLKKFYKFRNIVFGSSILSFGMLNQFSNNKIKKDYQYYDNPMII
jgi:hypothetical protein